MKWKHKKTGWIAQTILYCYPNEDPIVDYKIDGKDYNFRIPLKIIKHDRNWIEIDDDRWLYLQLNAKDFMGAFNMTISAGGRSHDSYVVKNLIDNIYIEKNK